jgi:hypothetical protein
MCAGFSKYIFYYLDDLASNDGIIIGKSKTLSSLCQASFGFSYFLPTL